jgi:peroxiredoxin family protein
LNDSGTDHPFWVLLLQRGAPDVLYEAAAMTASAASLGIGVTLIWFDGALEALASGRLSESEELADAWRLLREGREGGRVQMLACSASMVAGRPGPDAVRAKVDGIVGWPTAISLIRRAERSFVW